MGELSRRESREAFRDFIWQNVPEHLRTRTWQLLQSIVFTQEPILRELEYLEVRSGPRAPTPADYPGDGFGCWIDTNDDSAWVVLKWKGDFFIIGGSSSGSLPAHTHNHLTEITNVGVNTHSQIDTHIADGTIHFLESSINHTAIQNIGSNSHTAIDSHIADSTIHFLASIIDYALVSGNDAATDVTADELEELTDGSPTVLHTHGIAKSKVCLTTYVDKKERLTEWNLHGGLDSLDTASPLDSVPTDIVVTAGIGKLVIVINAGSDISGSIIVTGTSVNRDTGVETPADTDTITVDALTTDNSDTDAQGNVRWSFSGAYVTSKWFKGSVTLSTTDLTLTDVDTYQVAFEQVDDEPDVELATADMTAFATNASAWMYGYLYLLEVTGDKCAITRKGSLELPTADVSANKYYRLRRGDLGMKFNGTTDGFWATIFPGPLANTYWEDITTKFWFHIGISTSAFETQGWNAEDLSIGATSLSNASADTPDDGSESVQLASYSTMNPIVGSPARDLTQCWQADAGSGVSTDVYLYLGATKGFIPSEGLTMRIEAVIWDDGTGAFGRVGMLSEDGTNGIRVELNGTTLDLDTSTAGSWTQKASVASGLASAPSGVCWYVLSLEFNFATNAYSIHVRELGSVAAAQEDVTVNGTISSPTFDADTRLTKVYSQSAKTTKSASQRNGIAQLWISDDQEAFPDGYKQESNFVP